MIILLQNTLMTCVYLYILYIYIYICLFICLFICLSMYLFIHLFTDTLIIYSLIEKLKLDRFNKNRIFPSCLTCNCMNKLIFCFMLQIYASLAAILFLTVKRVSGKTRGRGSLRAGKCFLAFLCCAV